MKRDELKKIVENDLERIMNTDFNELTSEEAKDFWNRHNAEIRRYMSTYDEEELRKEIVAERGKDFEIEFNKKLNEVIAAIMNV
jgi:hypothetical protein